MLCFYPTQTPRECVTFQGDLTAAAVADLCSIASHPEITQIVPTIYPD
jgi:hypothetical protein